ncbi:SRPBCC family protein [Actinocrinis puniceicyclus]|uniref:SRPBCC family protein n=1 Tax=Actinocrinis puniceicyclus TaxID=977794 RepID=A0A8J7WR62_9ACTN|nr:SRPBCC family protein [Actinocrinis puniceicyclus]MBS2964932.1 SRPBCC family protein [Actinocrinis puniceicyclus]
MATKEKEVAQKAVEVAPGDQLRQSVQQLVETLTQRALSSATDRVGSTVGRLTEGAAGNGSSALASAGTEALKAAPSAVVSAGVAGTKSKLKEAAGGLKETLTGGGGGKAQRGGHGKLTNIVESIEIGAPIDVVYDQWTRFGDYPSFMKKVEHVEQVSPEKVAWKAQIFWSHRGWESTIREQVPDERIIWTSKGQKGSVDGAVTFHELAPDLTKVIVVLEYHPQGLFERTGNLWRAQGRRVRLELKHFQRHVMTRTLLHPDDVEGWRGEIHDGKVTPEPEREAGDEGENGNEARDQDRGQERDREAPGDEYDDEEGEYDARDEDDEPDAESDEEPEDEDESEDEDEDEAEPAPAARGRRPRART